MAPIAGKTVVVTGANRGIGLEFVRQLLQRQNNRVIATARNPEAAAELQALKPHAVLRLDVSDPQSIGRFADECHGQAGGHVDLLINNAGIYGPRKSLDNVTANDMVEVFRTNCVGPLLVTQQLLARGLLGDGGKGSSTVANMTSKVGSVADNGSGGSYAYRASKSALNIVNKSLSIDLEGRGITCVLLHPGYVRTGMTGGAGLIDTPECVAGLLGGVLESDDLPLNGCWYDFKREAIPW